MKTYVGIRDYIQNHLLPPDDNELEEDYLQAVSDQEPELSDDELDELIVEEFDPEGTFDE